MKKSFWIFHWNTLKEIVWTLFSIILYKLDIFSICRSFKMPIILHYLEGTLNPSRLFLTNFTLKIYFVNASCLLFTYIYNLCIFHAKSEGEKSSCCFFFKDKQKISHCKCNCFCRHNSYCWHDKKRKKLVDQLGSKYFFIQIHLHTNFIRFFPFVCGF